MDGDLQRYEQYVDELHEESVRSVPYEEVGYRYGETRCDETEGLIESTMAVILKGVRAD